MANTALGEKDEVCLTEGLKLGRRVAIEVLTRELMRAGSRNLLLDQILDAFLERFARPLVPVEAALQVKLTSFGA